MALARPPELEVQGLLRRFWDSSETSLASAPTINTGEFRRGDSPIPVISIAEGEEGPLTGSGTGYTAMDGAGKGGIQRVDGAVTVYCVAGTYDDLVTAGPGGTALNPKQVRWELYNHAAQLLVDHQDQTQFNSIAPGEATTITRSLDGGDNVSHEFRTEFRARYGYERRPE